MFKNKPFLIGGILIILLISLLFIVSSKYQSVYVDRFHGMDGCFKDGQFPCRWVLGQEFFYGSPIFNYLPPLPYYLGEAFFLITKSLIVSLKIIFAVSLVGGYIFMYLFTSKFLSKFKANLWAILYALLPFSAIVFYKEGLGISWGLMFLPIILLGLTSLLQERKIQNFLLSSISLSLLILSSYSAPILIGLIFFWIAYQYIRIKSLTYVMWSLISIISACLLASFYIFPSILERNLVHSVAINAPYRYLPKSAVEKPQAAPDSSYQILTGDSDISNFRQGTNWFRFEVDTKTHTIVRLSQFYFPHWKIFIDGKETQAEYKNNSLGLMTIILGEGKHTVEGKLFDTPIRTIANIVTVLSLISTLLLWITQFKGVKLWLNYYRKRVS